MTTEGNPNPAPNPTPASPAGKAPETPPGVGAAADFDAAVGREAAGHAARTDALSPAEIKTSAQKILDDPKSQYWKGGPDHDAQVALVFKMRELAAAAEGDAPEAMSTTQRLANRALSIGDLPIPRENMNPKVIESDTEFKNFVAWADQENVSTPIVRELLSEFANHGGGLGPLSDQAMNAIEAKFRGRLRGDQLALLRKWAIAELNPALAREASRRRGR